MNRVPTAVPGQGRACLRLLGAVVGPGEWRGGTGEPEKTRKLLEGSFNERRWKVGKKREKRNEDGHGKDAWINKGWDEGVPRAEGSKAEWV